MCSHESSSCGVNFFSKVDEIHTNLKFQCKLYRISPDIDVKHATNHSSFDGDNAISLSDIPFNSCSVLPLTLLGVFRVGAGISTKQARIGKECMV